MSILVIGGVSVDSIHTKGGSYTAPGGAGLYTALAAARVGIKVTLLSPKPFPMPDLFEPYLPFIDWVGRIVPPTEIGALSIAHYGGGKAELLSASWGELPNISLDDVGIEISGFELIHICPLGPVKKQIEIAQEWLNNGGGMISVGTYGRAAYQETEDVKTLLQMADYIFMNENEARGLWDGYWKSKIGSISYRQTLFITLGEAGVYVYHKGESAFYEIDPVLEMDPTGAGDTFCGTVLACLMKGEAIKDAVLEGVHISGKVIQLIGPSYFVSHLDQFNGSSPERLFGVI